jgi:hypothetical protein
MSTKEEISDRINEILGLKDDPIDLSKLPKRDLERLCRAIEDLAASKLLGSRLLNRPVGEIMNMRLKDLIREFREGGGPFGLGILPRIMPELEREK